MKLLTLYLKGVQALRVEIPPGKQRSPAIEGWAQTFADSRAINQSGLAIWYDRVSTSRAAATHIRYALRLARSKLESQLTLLIALSNLIWETMGD